MLTHWKTHAHAVEAFSCPVCGLENAQEHAKELAAWLSLAARSKRKDVAQAHEMAKALCVAINTAVRRGE